MGFLDAIRAAQTDPDAWTLRVKNATGLKTGVVQLPRQGVTLSEHLETQGCDGGRWRVTILSARSGKDGAAARAALREEHGQLYGQILVSGETDAGPFGPSREDDEPPELAPLELVDDLEAEPRDPANPPSRANRTLEEAKELRAEKAKLQQEIEVRRLQKELRLLEDPSAAPGPSRGGADFSTVILQELRDLKRASSPVGAPSWVETLPGLIAPMLQMVQAFMDGAAERNKAMLAVVSGRGGGEASATGALDAGWDKLLPLLKELVAFLNELKGGGANVEKSDFQAALEVGLPLLSGLRGRMNSTPKLVPATPAPAGPAGGGKVQDEMGKRVAAFVGHVAREAAADTDLEVAAENLEKLWAMLPREARTAIISSAPESLPANLARWLSEAQQGQLRQTLSTNATASQWVGEFIELLKQGEEEYLRHQRGVGDGQDVQDDPGAGAGGESPRGPGGDGPGPG